jgi:hypothetical protein
MRRSVLTLVPLNLLLGSCSGQADGGGFGDAKAPNNTGMIQPPIEQPAGPPDFAGALTVTPRFDKAAGTVVVTLAIKPGFHAYAPGEAVGKPVELSIDNTGGWTMDGAAKIPTGVEKDLGAMGKSMILEGQAEVSAVVKGGAGPVSGKVTVQVCTDKACDRPKPHAFNLPTT